jgi:hypothetical protein
LVLAGVAELLVVVSFDRTAQLLGGRTALGRPLDEDFTSLYEQVDVTLLERLGVCRSDCKGRVLLGDLVVGTVL